MRKQSNHIVLYIEQGANFIKTFRWKDRYKEPINITGFLFKSQFKFNLGDDEENIVCTLTNGDGITLTEAEGTIQLTITSDITISLKSYDSGIWSLEYKPDEESVYRKLLGGSWKVEAEVTS